MAFFPLAASLGSLTGLERPGGGDQTPLVLLHGIQGTARSWQGVMERLPAGFPVLVPNLRGRAGSPVPAQTEAYALAQFAEDLEAVLAAVGRPVVLAGWSMGVLVTLAYLQRFGPQRLRALALVSGTACPGDDARWFRGDNAEAIAQEARQRAENLKLVESAAPVAVAGAWLSARSCDFRAELARIDRPTLVIHGTEDDQCPLTHGRLMADHIAGSRFAVYESGGHNLLAQFPRELAEQLAALRS
jgi:pimeloyl-ACP methyl ester carboxylesterase